ncbi:MAG TPA: 3-phosphoshikimate 1-carboxyvinyltransferase [Gemmatales bacterium]|nr:3-phosphoshikimate 1-carboxyvinyltransferase [Gemmatales bacterium]
MVKSMIDPYEVRPLDKPPHCTVQVPGSKSITNRALILAALAQPAELSAVSSQPSASVLENALRSDDTEVMIDSLQRLGIAVEVDWANNRITVPCTPVSKWHKSAEFFCGNSGTTIRFLTAMLSVGEGTYRLDGVGRMRERPIGDLVEALQQLGVDIRCEHNNGCPPIILNAHGLPGGTMVVRGNISSQYLSALMMAAPSAQASLSIEVQGELVSVPYVTITLAMMRDWGVDEWGIKLDGQADLGHRERHNVHHFMPRPYQARRYTIEPDASSASYFWGAAAITGGVVSIPGLASSVQGDARFYQSLLRMGCRAVDEITLQGQPLHSIDIDMNAISDTVMTLAVVALFAKGSTKITNVAHIRHKETDRLTALATELRKVGAEIVEHPDGLTIHPRPLHGATLDTYDDHRMAMSLALIGLKIPGIFIRNPGCVTKTFPTYWHTLENLRQ